MDYVACLNKKAYDDISKFVDDAVIHNGRELGASGYKQLIKDSFETYRWLHFNVGLLAVDEAEQTVASRLILKGTDPEARDVPTEHVFYKFRNRKIVEVWSLLDDFDS